jgi:hypothetical protein
MSHHHILLNCAVGIYALPDAIYKKKYTFAKKKLNRCTFAAFVGFTQSVSNIYIDALSVILPTASIIISVIKIIQSNHYYMGYFRMKLEYISPTKMNGNSIP